MGAVVFWIVCSFAGLCLLVGIGAVSSFVLGITIATILGRPVIRKEWIISLVWEVADVLDQHITGRVLWSRQALVIIFSILEPPFKLLILCIESHQMMI